jgi:hypothetical protein
MISRNSVKRRNCRTGAAEQGEHSAADALPGWRAREDRCSQLLERGLYDKIHTADQISIQIARLNMAAGHQLIIRWRSVNIAYRCLGDGDI